jgi:hypothetical protein
MTVPGAATAFGALPLDPVTVGLDPDGDIVIRVFGDYLKAVMLSRLNAAWIPVSGAANGSIPIVKQLGFNNPEDNTFSHRDLPGLYVYRDKRDIERPEKLADDLWQDTRRLIVHWIPNPVSQELEAKRAPFLEAIRKVIKSAIFQERHPAWKKTSETNQYALLKGTCITSTCGLLSRPIVEGVEEATFTVSIEGEDEPAGPYVGLKATIRTVEASAQDSTGFYPTIGEGFVDNKADVLNPTVRVVGQFSALP